MSERRWMSAQEPDESEPSDAEAGAWPVWEVQGYGTVTTAGDPLVGPARREIRPPWVDIRLTFADGARIDVLAVVHEGRIAIEDAQADPPLPLDGFAALAGVIEAPLQDACKVVAGQDGPPAPGPSPAPEPAPTFSPTPAPSPTPTPAPSPTPTFSPSPPPEPALAPAPTPTFSPTPTPTPAPAPAPEPEPALAPAPTPTPAPTPMPGPEPPVLDLPDPLPDPPAPAAAREPEPGPGEAGSGAGPQVGGRHRAGPARGGPGHRTVAGIYRAAQRDGLDPVLAVMSATGFSRRKSLRLIAGARDEGHLSPRHHRR
ncbi:DUF6214 family protein [Streptomyces sp. NPDC088261]|uniref:DUF6214 family protein n=1 Tax=Streptomyces sp. NPDC088261 TaxID=3365851 RepID=UPI00380C92EE